MNNPNFPSDPILPNDPFRIRARTLQHAHAFMSDILCLVAQDGGPFVRNTADTRWIAELTTEDVDRNDGLRWGIMELTQVPAKDPEIRPHLQRSIAATFPNGSRIVIFRIGTQGWRLSAAKAPSGLDGTTFAAFHRLVGGEQASKYMPSRLPRGTAFRAIAATIALHRRITKKDLDPDALLAETARLMDPGTHLFTHPALAIRENRRLLSSIALRLPADIAFRPRTARNGDGPCRDFERFGFEVPFFRRRVIAWSAWFPEDNATRWDLEASEIFTEDQEQNVRQNTVSMESRGFSLPTFCVGFDGRQSSPAFALSERLHALNAHEAPRRRKTRDLAIAALLAFGVENARLYGRFGRLPHHEDLRADPPAPWGSPDHLVGFFFPEPLTKSPSCGRHGETRRCPCQNRIPNVSATPSRNGAAA